MTLAERIYNGWTAEQLGISPQDYQSRKDTLVRFLATWKGGDFDPAYRAWLKGQSEGDRGQDTPGTKGMRIKDSRKKPCNCKGGRIR